MASHADTAETHGAGGRYTDSEGNLSPPKLARLGVLALLVLIVLMWLWPFHSVPTGIARGGDAVRQDRPIEPEGLVVLPPWQKLALFSIRAEARRWTTPKGRTSDTQPVHVSLTVRYSIFPDRVAEVYEKYSHNGDLSSYVQTSTQEVFKAVTARYTAPDLIAKRSLVSGNIGTALAEKLAKYGAQVINIDMRSFAFQDSYMRAINSKVEQEQLRLAAENRLLTVEAEQKQKVAVAEAEANAVKAKADGDSYALLKNATAQADALKVQNAALSQSKEVLELRRIEVEQTKADRWNGQLPQNVYAGTPIPFFQPH